jgi:hypothetical protein
MLRLFAYMAGLAVLGVLGVIFFRLPDVVAAVAPAPRPQWIEVERPHPAFELVMPELGGLASGYSIFRREADGARKDVLSWGEAAGSGPYVVPGWRTCSRAPRSSAASAAGAIRSSRQRRRAENARPNHGS